MSSPAGQLERVVREEPEPAPAPPGDVLAAPHRRLSGRLAVSLMVAAIVITLGGSGVPVASAAAHNLHSRAAGLHARWAQMVGQGVPDSDLAVLEAEWRAANAVQVFGAGSVFWLPDATSTVDRWQAETDAVWAGNLRVARAAAVAAEGQLHAALAVDSDLDRKARRDALESASTPADFMALRTDWELQARLIPIDQRIAAQFGRLTALVGRATLLGISSGPADAVLLDANNYTLLDQGGRFAHAEQLIRGMTALDRDLGARIAAATITKRAFSRAASEISLGTMYELNLTAYQARVATDRTLYATVTTPGQFNAITADLNETVAAIQQSLNVLRSRTHVVSGVQYYRQIHALSCEETATSMALTHQGIYLSQDQILAELGADLRPQYVDSRGILRWGNPYLRFVGYVDGYENVTGLQANYPPLVRVARAHGARIIAYGWMPAESIYARLTAGHPVVVYATYDWAWHPRHDYLSFDGRWIPFIGPALSHVYTAIGVRPDAVLVNDPIRGQYWVNKRSFEAGYSDFQEAIVFA